MRTRQKIVSASITFIILILAFVVFLRLNFNHSKNYRPFKDFIKDVVINDSYLIHDQSNLTSIDTDSKIDVVRKIESNEIRGIVNEVDKLEINESFLSNYSFLSINKKCFYTTGNVPAKYFICFKNNRITNYIRVFNNKMIHWSVVGEEKVDIGMFIASTPDLQSCIVDSDCSLQSKGICTKVDEVCEDNPDSCGAGSKISINSKYDFVWNSPRYNQNKCIKSGEYANPDLGEHYSPVCRNYTCSPVVIKP